MVQRLNEHTVEAHRHLCQSVKEGMFERAEGWVRAYTGSTVSTFNFLLLLNDRALTDDILSDSAAYFNERRVPHVVAFDEHRVRGGSKFLHARSYLPLPPQPGMVLLGPPRRLGRRSDVLIESVGATTAMSSYCGLVSELFGLPLTDTTRLFSVNQSQAGVIRHFLGTLNGEPVVVGTSVLAAGIVSVWNVATHDDVRGQGVATALIERLLQDAWEDGCDASLLYSSPMAYSLFQKLGYELHTQRHCFLPPEW